MSLDDMIPPKEMVFVGEGDFLAVGQEFLDHFIRLGSLRPSDRVLDVGCGIGRIAVPLTQYLRGGSYDGFDIVPSGIEWCRERISSRYPNFRFRLADIHNGQYNPQGKISARTYRFPYPSRSFHFVVLTSVFTHLLPDDMRHYFAEIGRVMRPGAQCLITWFLINPESLGLVHAGKGSVPLIHDCGIYRATDPVRREGALGYDEAYVLALYRELGLDLSGPVQYGSWCGREHFLTYQDIIVARKPRADERVVRTARALFR